MRFAELIRGALRVAPRGVLRGGLRGESRGRGVLRGVLVLRGEPGLALRALTTLVVAGLPACASIDLSPQRAAPAPAAATAAAAAAAKAAVPPNAETIVNPATQLAFDQARAALAAGRTEEAERAFLALTRSSPELAGPHANLALIHRQQGKLADAVAELEQAVHTSPNQPVYYNQLGITYRELGQFVKAREAYDKAISLDPNYASAYLNLGILYDVYFWDSKRALELYDHYMALTPAGDDKVKKWIADIKNRAQKVGVLSRKEQP